MMRRRALSLTAVASSIVGLIAGNFIWCGLGHGTASIAMERSFWEFFGSVMVYLNSLWMDREVIES